MPDFLPMFFIVCGALALVGTLFWLWQSLREALLGAGTAASSAYWAASSEREKLLSEKQALLLALKDLGAEREAGKLSNEDWDELNARYRARAREVLSKLDAQLAPHRAEAKRLLAAALSGVPVTEVAAKGETVSSAAPAAGLPAHRKCGACATDNDADAVFCKKCGGRVAPAEAS